MPYMRKQPRGEDSIEYSDLDEIDILTRKKTDPRQEHVFCVFCDTKMSLLNTPDIQWLCENCGSIAKAGLGDTPTHDTSLTALATPNNPYATEIDTITRTVIENVLLPGDEGDEYDKDPSMYDVNKRTGMQWRQTNKKWLTDIQQANRLI